MKMKINRILLFVILIFLLGTIIIHLLYKFSGPSWVTSEWSAGDALAYYGAVLASVITIFGFYLTFKDNRTGIKEQSRLDKLPFMTMNILQIEYHVPWIGDAEIRVDSQAFNNDTESYYFREKRLDGFFCVINNGKVNFTNKFSQQQLDNIKRKGMVWENLAQGVLSLVDNKLIYIPMIITNYGNGVAVDFRFGLNNSNENKDSRKYIMPFSIGQGESIYVAIYCENSLMNNDGEYEFELFYQDMFGNNYQHINKLNININSDKPIATFERQNKQMMLIDDSLV